MVVEVLANGGEIDDSRDVDASVQSRVANAGNLKNLGRVQGSSSQDDFLGSGGSLRLSTFAGGKLNTPLAG